MFTKSIRWRFQMWLGFLLVCVLSGFALTVYQLQRMTRFHDLDQQLEQRVAAVSSAVRRPPMPMRPGGPPFGMKGGPWNGGDGPRRGFGPDRDRPSGPPPDGHHPPWGERGDPRDGPRDVRLPAETAALFEETLTNGFYYAVWSQGGTLLTKSTNAPITLSFPEKISSDTAIHIRETDAVREAYHFTERSDCILAGRSIRTDILAMRQFAWWLLGAGTGVLALGLGGAWGLVTRAIRPINDISRTARQIAEGNLSERITVGDTDNELDRLGVVLNSTFDRLETAFEQQAQFTADASHELRTPLAVIISEAQTTLARERDAAQYRETVEACLAAAQQMRKLTDSLMCLARFDAGQEMMERTTIDVSEVINCIVDLIQPLVEERGLRLQCDLRTAKTVGDPQRLGQVVTNLVSNAIYYNRPEGAIHLRCWADEEKVFFSVADTGQGISSEDLSKIFDRFYRADKSRSRSDGRNGLGLAISRAIIEAHQGQISVESTLGQGSIFTVTLPTWRHTIPVAEYPRPPES
jgi:two-component system OmpR family sensor kinase